MDDSESNLPGRLTRKKTPLSVDGGVSLYGFEREASEPFGSRVTYIATAKGAPLKLFQLEHLVSRFQYEPVATADVSCDHPLHVALNHAPPALFECLLIVEKSTGAVIRLGKPTAQPSRAERTFNLSDGFDVTETLWGTTWD